MKFPEADSWEACFPKVSRRVGRAVFTNDSTGFGITYTGNAMTTEPSTLGLLVLIAVPVVVVMTAVVIFAVVSIVPKK
ncbi:MAG TPA: hypothetical protein DEB39_06885 [Planctomycetaceae bacterium]|nr:hypothetical protein [Planctomycetaceae bacterium]